MHDDGFILAEEIRRIHAKVQGVKKNNSRKNADSQLYMCKSDPPISEINCQEKQLRAVLSSELCSYFHSASLSDGGVSAETRLST